MEHPRARTILRVFLFAFGTGFSGAVVPGPLLVVCAHLTLRAGFAAGMMTVVGHALTELALVAALLAGLSRHLKQRADILRLVKLLGGAVLVVLGTMMVATAPPSRLQVGDAAGRAVVAGPLLVGAAVSIGNPYFVLWWATAGLALLGSAARSGRMAVGVFYVGHVLSDFVWYAFVAGSLAIGRRTVIDPTLYRLLLAASGIFMVAFGAYFALSRPASPAAS